MKMTIMKYSYFSICLTILFLACSKEISDSARLSTSNHISMSEALVLVEYKHDLTARPSNEEIELVPSIGRVMQTASNRDKRILFENYPRAKKHINEWMQINQGLNHSKYIQNIALQYLRRLILEDNSNWAQDETKHLLGILIQLKSVDLEVLADAFTKVQHRIIPG